MCNRFSLSAVKPSGTITTTITTTTRMAYNHSYLLLERACCKMVYRSDADSYSMKEMNTTPSLLIMKVTVVTVTMNCTPDHPKNRALVVNCQIKHIMFSYSCCYSISLNYFRHNCHILSIPGMIKLSSENFPITYLESTNYLNLVSYCDSRTLISLSHLSMLTF